MKMGKIIVDSIQEAILLFIVINGLLIAGYAAFGSIPVTEVFGFLFNAQVGE